MPSTSVWLEPGEYHALTTHQKLIGKSWTRSANFRTIPRSELPINPYNHGQRSWKQALWQGYTRTRISDGYFQVVNSPQIAYYPFTIKGQHDLMYVAAGVEGVIASMTNEALIQALGRAADTKANVGVTLAEASKTSTMILDTASRIYRAARAFKRGNFVEVAKQLHLSPKAAHNNWLAYKYGWQPLLMEVKGAAEFFAQQSLGRAIHFSVKGKSKRSVELQRLIPDSLFGDGVMNWTRQERFTADLEVKIKLWLEITSPALSASQQVGLTNPALVVWELVPFSFVFDWFIHVGDYLEALTALNGLSVRRSMIEVVDSTLYSGYYDGVSNYPFNGYLNNYAGRSFSDERREYKRAPFDVNSHTLYPPAKLDLSWSRLTSGLALLRAQSRGLARGLRM